MIFRPLRDWPPAMFTVGGPEAGEAAYQPVRAEMELPQRDFFVGESIGARLLVIETPDESPQAVSAQRTLTLR